MAEWRFRQMQRSEVNRDPVEKEFFRDEDPIRSLVRESIQNSLDADNDPDKPVVVRFFIGKIPQSERLDVVNNWFTGLSPHLDLVIQANPLSEVGDLNYLVIEDFGTRGLTGDILAARPNELTESGKDFFYFWRNVGRSGKAEDKRGSWGLGKAVYAASSRIRSFFGWTVRQTSPSSILMGQAVLGIHQIKDSSGNLIQHDAYGFFGDFGEDRDADFVAPVESSSIIERLRETFNLIRVHETGLSLVIPFPSDELVGEEAVAKLARAVIEQYGYPILDGNLQVRIENATTKFELRRENIVQVTETLDWNSDSLAKERIRKLHELAAWSLTTNADENRVALGREETLGASWTQIQFPSESWEVSRRQFAEGEPVAIRVPVLIRPREGDRELSQFDVYFRKDEQLRANAFRAIRQGLSILDIPGPSASGIIGLLVVQHGPIAQLLCAAENPSHTRWISKEDQLVRQFIGGDERVQFVTSAVRVLLKHLMKTETVVDKDLLSEFFPDRDDDAHIPSTGARRRHGTKPDETEILDIEVKRRPLRTEKLSGGFKVARNVGVPLPDARFGLETAFDCDGANPFKAYEHFDFDLKGNEFTFEIQGGRVIRREWNKIVAYIESDEFELHVQGFPVNRDLVVSTPRFISEEDEGE